MRQTDLTRLRNFYTRLIDGDLVVEFDPDIPPKKVSQNAGVGHSEIENPVTRI